MGSIVKSIIIAVAGLLAFLWLAMQIFGVIWVLQALRGYLGLM